ncbi:MAG TPA: hypothetical protein VMP03_05750 [Methylomirabilota bacterium]|nr:hypothetical protein [Methylomirabilota bacterium]
MERPPENIERDPTKPGNRGTYVAILAAAALAIVLVLALYPTGDEVGTTAPPAATVEPQ